MVGPAGVPHAWRNPSEDEELRLLSELRPALHMEMLFETSYSILRDLKADKMGAPRHLLRLAVLAGEAGDDFYFTEPPMRVIMALFRALAPVGRMLDYGPSSPKYSDPE